MFQINKFKKALSTKWVGHDFLFFEELGSTNTYVKQLSRDEISHGMLCLANHQTQGRGQYEKKWETRPGKNLTFTLTFTPREGSRLHIFTLICAKAIIDEIEEQIGLNAYIKWPNDVIIQGKKIGGLLTESTFNGNKIDRLMIGVGLNINQEIFSDDLKEKASSLKLLTGEKQSREHFLANLLSRIEYGYGRWHRRDNSLIKEINQKIQGYGQWVRLKVDNEIREDPAKLLGMNEYGQLAVINQEGEIETFSYEQIRVITD